MDLLTGKENPIRKDIPLKYNATPTANNTTVAFQQLEMMGINPSRFILVICHGCI